MAEIGKSPIWPDRTEVVRITGDIGDSEITVDVELELDIMVSCSVVDSLVV